MKKIFVAIICGVLALSITGCSYSDVFNNKDDKDTNTGVTDNKEDTRTPSKEETKGIDVAIGQNIQYDDNYNISFIENSFKQKVEPSNPDSYYHYFEPKDTSSNTFLVLKTVIKNLGTETLDGEKLPKAKLIYDGKYKYDAQLITEEDDGSDLDSYSWYMDIDPLKTKKIWYLVEVPKEVETNTQATLVMQYQINGKTYNVKIR